MELSRAGKRSRGLLFALLASAFIHLCLLANIAYQTVSENGNSGIAPKFLQVLVKVQGTGGEVSVPVMRRVTDSANHRDQRLAPAAQNAPTLLAAVQEKSFAPLAPASRESMMQSTPPGEPSGASKPATEELGAGRGGVVRDSVPVEAGAIRHVADEMRSYRIALASTARKFKVYPPMARERGIGGRSEVMVVLTPFGAPEVSLRVSSGEPSLDQAALDMMQRSVRAVELPFALRNQRMEFMLPVEFVPGS